MRRAVVWDAEKQREIVLLTNHLNFGATTIFAIFRDRWQIDLCFEAQKRSGHRQKSQRLSTSS